MAANHGYFRAIIYVLAGITLLFVLAPLLVTLALSVSNGPFATFPPNGFTVRWYVQVLSDREFIEAAALSIGLALSSTAAALILGVPAALAIHRGTIPGSAGIQSLLLSPLIFPVLITGLALLQFTSWGGLQLSTVNMFFGYTLIALPYVVRTVAASLKLVDPSLEEAARTLGADPFRTFIRVTIPQIAPGIAAGSLFAFMIGLDNYTIAMWFADAQVTPLSILMMKSMTRVFDPSIAAMAGILILIGALAVIILERLVGLRRAMGV
jgi:putative spermidine/putrescine transport system permease protein